MSEIILIGAKELKNKNHTAVALVFKVRVLLNPLYF